jgi:uncharacterized membrane protein
MKGRGWIHAVLILASLAWVARMLTVPRLKDRLLSLDQSRKIVVTEFKQIERSEERIRTASHQLICSISGKYGMDSFQGLNAGDLTPHETVK